MSKRNNARPKGPTHFETVPLEVVKEVAIDIVPTAQVIAADKIVKPAKKRSLTAVPSRAPAGRKG
jgi:hypothetical protein